MNIHKLPSDAGVQRKWLCRGFGAPLQGRRVGGDVSTDDASRIAFSQILPDEHKECAAAFLSAAVAYCASLGVVVTRV